jgi:hypothetical protein
MNQGYKVEYSEDMNEVCLIPFPSIDLHEFCNLTKQFGLLGYKWWLPADDRRGYLYCKDTDLYYKKRPDLIKDNSSIVR